MAAKRQLEILELKLSSGKKIIPVFWPPILVCAVEYLFTGTDGRVDEWNKIILVLRHCNDEILDPASCPASPEHRAGMSDWPELHPTHPMVALRVSHASTVQLGADLSDLISERHPNAYFTLVAYTSQFDDIQCQPIRDRDLLASVVSTV